MKEPNRERKKEIKFNIQLNEEQKRAKQVILENKITVLRGKAGTAKSTTAANTALDMLFKKMISKIIVTRPLVTSGEELGFLPGPQPLWSKVLTPTGWSTIGELNIGDKVINKNGGESTIIDKSEISYEDIYKITTSDGRVTHCGINHLFYTDTFYSIKQNKPGSVKSLKDMIDTFHDIHGKPNHYLPYCEPIQFEKTKEHFIHPYIMGCLLGDGCFSKNSSIVLSSSDDEIIEKCQQLVEKHNITLNRSPKHINYNFSYDDFYCTKNSREVVIEDMSNGETIVIPNRKKALEYTKLPKGQLIYKCENRIVENNIRYSFLEPSTKSINPIKNEIIRLGLLGHKAHNKFIPKEYIYNSSIEDRIELLRGLMDTDGSNNHTCATFTTSSPILKDDIIELVRSLGGKATYLVKDKIGETVTGLKNINAKTNFLSYEVWINLDINPFYLSRKKDKYNPKFKHKIRITNIEKLNKDNIQCLSLDSTDGLYITDDYVVTHNSIKEKTDPYTMSIYDNMYKLYSKEKIDKEIAEGNIEVVPLAYMRGRNFSNCCVILDEAQNCTMTQLELILTRMCIGSKIIICGDSQQIDLKDKVKSGFDFICKHMRDIPGFIIYTMTTNHRDPIVEEIVKVYDSYR
jgi:phosphate starvation-inducible PhoH-like protein